MNNNQVECTTLDYFHVRFVVCGGQAHMNIRDPHRPSLSDNHILWGQ